MVNELINEDLMCWNIIKMDENLKPIDAAVICTIPMVYSLKMIGPSVDGAKCHMMAWRR
jgi:hypothetical protein